MFLKSLSMKGFKSFADPTVLEFEPGITVVVGPNGSGKSNVVDAVTWVLGAQGPRSLRSVKMEDVIFAGTTSRPALGRAEVSLTIDNSSAKLPVDMAEVTITRTLFRSGESEYAINATPCRLLDVQELLGDSGVGRQQHMIIGQGQLDTVLNARPEDRRAIIEEAAGVLKHRRRRERAERRLAATQENLERLGDLVREVRRQIRPLERQAAAARSHATVADELLTVRLYLAASELADLNDRRTTAAEALRALGAEETELHGAMTALDEAATATAAELSSRREEDLATSLGRVQGLVERTRGTAGVLRERSRALVAALDAAADVDVVSTLEAEGARLASELASAEAEAARLDPELAELGAIEEAVAADERAHIGTFGIDGGLSGAEDALERARNRLEVLEAEAERAAESIAGLDHGVEVLEGRAGSLSGSADEHEVRTGELEAEAARLAEALGAAEAAVLEATAVEHEAEGVATAADQHRHRTAARAEALARALHELEGAGGREVLEGIDGVVGSLVDLVEIDRGWEAAFEAAAGASVAAVVVAGPDAARAALAALHRQGATGALLAARLDAAERPADTAGLPFGAEPLRAHVRLRTSGPDAGVGGVLDALVGRAVRVAGWEQAIDLALDRPDLVVVTGQGDRFATSGWRVRSNQGVVTAVAVEEAQEQADGAARTADGAADHLGSARRTLEEARSATTAALRALDRHDAAMAAVRAERARLEEESARIRSELEEARSARSRAGVRLAEAAALLSALLESIPELEVAVAAAALRAEEAAAAKAVLEGRRAEVVSLRQALEVRSAGLVERRRVLAARHLEVERRLEGHADEREEAAERRRRLEADGLALERLGELVERERELLDGVLESIRLDYRNQVEAVRAGGERLEALRRDRAATERRQAEVRERTRALDLEAAEVSLRSESLADTVRRELNSNPSELAGVSVPQIPEGTTAADHAGSLADKLASLGPVNPLALEELSVLEERHRELDTQVDDVRSARRELQEVVRTLDDEIMQSFAAAAADVNEHFSTLVAMLFPGGTGRLSLTEPDDLLNTGVDVEVRPAGRNVRRVSLLSGGERSLAALAFLFAVFRSRPSPFYLMDEVEAALDDVNLHRFLSLVREFRHEAQLIIVSHQKRTMETADALYGVTMAPGGSSQVVSQRVDHRSEPETANS
jgi:chromosome segregation protein